MKKIFLITKLRTTNIGNQALSHEIIQLFKQCNPSDSFHVAGRPMGLDGYIHRRLINSSSPEAKLDRWADNVIKRIKSGPKIEFKSTDPKVEMLLATSGLAKLEPFKARLRPVKRVLSALRAFNKPYQMRAAMLQEADWLIYSGAGEVGDNDVFLRQLLELRIAQKMGIRTAAVNQSVVIHTPLFQQLTAHVYGKMNVVVVRGEITASNLKRYGVPEGIIQIAPDSAINSSIDNPRPSSTGKVGLNLTPKCNATQADMERIAGFLKAAGKQPVFITNEPYEDATIARALNRIGLPEPVQVADYHAYMEQLSGFDFVISARLHTNILSLASQTPIIPIEGNVFKTTELLSQLKYPVHTVDPAQAGWVDDLLNKTGKMLKGEYDIHTYFTGVLSEQKMQVKKNASWLSDY